MIPETHMNGLCLWQSAFEGKQIKHNSVQRVVIKISQIHIYEGKVWSFRYSSKSYLSLIHPVIKKVTNCLKWTNGQIILSEALDQFVHYLNSF